MQFKMYPEVTIVIERPGKYVYILMADLKIKIYRIIFKQDINEIKILFKNADNEEKILTNREKIEEKGYEIRKAAPRTTNIFLKGYDPELEKNIQKKS